ncbi:MAG TPA: hypothetical protein VFT19_05995 [Solirubrobacterales bacterium]|nr:hypothetical protein [Solirubrobacterales bacterium]
MEAMRESWTDDRLDDLSTHIDQRFDQVDQRFKQVDRRFDQIDRRFELIDQRFEQVDRRFERIEDAIKEQGKELNGKIETLRDDLYGELISIHKTIARIGWAGMTALIAAAVGALATVLF